MIIWNKYLHGWLAFSRGLVDKFQVADGGQDVGEQSDGGGAYESQQCVEPRDALADEQDPQHDGNAHNHAPARGVCEEEPQINTRIIEVLSKRGAISKNTTFGVFRVKSHWVLA